MGPHLRTNDVIANLVSYIYIKNYKRKTGFVHKQCNIFNSSAFSDGRLKFLYVIALPNIFESFYTSFIQCFRANFAGIFKS